MTQVLNKGLRTGIRKRIRCYLRQRPVEYDRARSDARNWALAWYRVMVEKEPTPELMNDIERYIDEAVMES